MRSRVRHSLWPDGFGLLIATIAVLSTVLVLQHNATYGVKLSWDSLVYINVARNLLAGDGFVTWDGSALTVWPPLYPVLLAVVGLGVFDPHDVAGPLNAVVFGLTIFVLGNYLRERLASRLLVIWVCIAVPLCFHLVYQATRAVTAPVFILVTTVSLIFTEKFFSEGKRSALVLAAVFSALAFQQRYIGVVVPLFVGLLLVCAPGVAVRHRIHHITLFALIVGGPMALWMLRNYFLVGHVSGSQQPMDYKLATILWDTIGYLAKSVYPERTSGPNFVLPATLAFILLIVAYILARNAKRKKIAAEHGVRTMADWRPCAIFGGFALVYFACLVVAMMLGFANRGVEMRYVIPMYIPVWTVLAFVLDALIEQDKAMRPPRTWVFVGRSGHGAPWLEVPTWPALALFTALSVWVSLQVKPAVREIELANTVSHNSGLFGGVSARSDILRYIRSNPLDGLVYSNHPELVALYNGGSSHIDLPRAAISKEWLYILEEHAHLVWLKNIPNPRRFDLPQLYSYTPELVPIAEFADGTIFEVTKSAHANR